MRDITLGDTFYHFFTTRAFATGVPTQLAGTPVLSVLEENNATPITAGVSLSVDRASVTGLNQATIVATSGNGYESGKSYAIYISTGTVGGVSVVGEVVGEFTIQASAAAVDLANGTDGLGAIKTDTAAILVDTGTTLDTKINNIQGATFSSATDSLEAIRDRGDAAWDTATGFSTHSAADVWTAAGRTLSDSPGIKKNTALANFMFLMVDSTDHVTPKTGLTITAQRSLDGAAFAACANAATELSNGVYVITLAATDLNADVVTLKFTGTAADQRTITIVTET